MESVTWRRNDINFPSESENAFKWTKRTSSISAGIPRYKMKKLRLKIDALTEKDRF